jgi:2-oxoglutarate ferredoxin oxidoreductase subunit beta
MVNHSLIGLAVSGDGDTASIGLGQFKHLLRRNVPLVYIVENNGVYGLTKGQFSATADIGQELKYAGRNELLPIDIALEAVISGCGYVARTFSGDAKQVVTLLKGALCHNGTAVLDIISPCMAFNNHNESTKSYTWGKKHNTPLHDITYIPSQTEISVDYELGTTHTVELHDGASLILKKLDADYDPTDQAAAIRLLTEARAQQLFITGLVYYNPNRPSLRDLAHLPKTPLVNLANEQLRPSPQSLQELMGELS